MATPQGSSLKVKELVLVVWDGPCRFAAENQGHQLHAPQNIGDRAQIGYGHG